MNALLALYAVALALPVWAHHSHNAYEVTVWSDLEGTVTDVYLMNPHSWIFLDVTDENGETTTWSLEAASPNSILENGVKPEDVRPGDRIKVRIHLLRDGTNGGLLGFVTPLHGDQARGHGIELEWD
ncbi:MAG: DUF6152 family protein [Rhodospirillaceae bacterium]|nr:DUF6152 family protein [Rhodospirillaceae bacterium]